MRLNQLPSLNLIFIRFTTPTSIKKSDSASESWTLLPLMKEARSFENKTLEKKILNSQKFIYYRYDKTDKTYPK